MNTGSPVHQVPGKALGIWAFVLAFLIPLLGLIFGFIALGQSRRAGLKNGFAVAGIVISLVWIAAAVITTIAISASGGWAMR